MVHFIVNSIFPGVTHVDELLYLFNYNSVGPLFKKTDPEVEVMKNMTELWTSFATEGVPFIVGTEWKACTSTKVQTLFIANVSLGPEPYQNRFELWDRLYPLNGSAAKASISFLIIVGMMLLNYL